MHGKLFAALLLASVTLFAGCSDPNTDAPRAEQVHPADWVCLHAAEADTQAKLQFCTSCHGLKLEGSGQVPACSSCHAYNSAPPFTLHPTRWATDALDEHQHFHNTDLASWTTCAVSACHGGDLKGGQEPCETGPSCFLVACHAGGPVVPHNTPFADPALHGVEAKDGNLNGNNLLVCRNCHGRPLNTFDGGFISDPAILNNANGNCSAAACHPAAKAHPTNWQGTNDAADVPFNHFSTHRTVSGATVAQACALCHKTVSVGAGPMPGAPSCFSAMFTNADGSATSCHPSGQGVAPHAVDGSYLDPGAHGSDAKADLTFCQGCHGTDGGPGSNPRFNLAIGNLAKGCEDCHALDRAHPDVDRWTFPGEQTSIRRTHFGASNIMGACTLCHGVALDGVGGIASSCFTCHVSAPLFRLQCTACHGNPPTEATPVLPGSTLVDHDLGRQDNGTFLMAAHDECVTCHGVKDDGTGQLSVTGSDYAVFDGNNPQGGDHLDGHAEMNGPTLNVGAGYNQVDFGCDNACHVNDAAHQLSDSTLEVEFGNYGTGSASCNTCHGYPPTDTTPDSTGATLVDHDLGRQDGGAFLMAAHNDCVTCHGNRDDGTANHSPQAPYDLATDHEDGSIEMNGPSPSTGAGYDDTNFGCDNACHANDAAHQLSDASNGVLFPVEFADYGSGSCNSCHDTGALVNGTPAPIVITNVTPHASSWTCEGCHTGHGIGTIEIPNNPTIGIDYTANGEAGISLGGANAPGATEAQICWGCHDTFVVSEWGQNHSPATGNMAYDYGQIYSDAGTINMTSNWVGAFWQSGTAQFGYKTAAIQSTHAANPAAAGPGTDAVGDIRCSYCHDVHELAMAPGDTAAGVPYLRGTWMGNPYPEDGAPQLNTVYAGGSEDFGAVPRGGMSYNATGGYQIDQNNGNPTSGWTANSSAGLCELCHGNGDGSWAAAEIDNINAFGVASADWVGSNGHSNSTIGGSGANASNIFTTGDRHQTLPGTGGTSDAGNPTMAYLSGALGDNRGYGFRSNANDPRGWNLDPRIQGGQEPRVYTRYNWGASVDNTTPNLGYHQFSCSKCHNPHASRLPRLMITNCLDTKHNTWDDGAAVNSLPAAGTSNSAGSDTISAENGGVTFSNSTAAQNCHRLSDSAAFPNARGSGWNLVTPW